MRFRNGKSKHLSFPLFSSFSRFSLLSQEDALGITSSSIMKDFTMLEETVFAQPVRKRARSRQRPKKPVKIFEGRGRSRP
jgi:hypothetical protein